MTTDYGTTIGIIYTTDEKAHLISVAQFCEALNNGSLHYIDEDYFDDTVCTDLVKFHFDPYSGSAIDWKEVERLVMHRHSVVAKVSPPHKIGEGVWREYIGKVDEQPKNFHFHIPTDEEPHPFTVKADLRTFFDPAKIGSDKVGLSITDRAIPDDVVIPEGYTPRYSISEDFKKRIDELFSDPVAMENYRKTLAEFGILDKTTDSVVSAFPAIVADE